MGYAHYTLDDGREAGYGVDAVCDEPGCDAKIDRGLAYLCGAQPDPDDGEGCGRYFCGEHLFIADDLDWLGGICGTCVAGLPEDDQLEQAITDKPVSVEADRSAVDKPATSQPQKPAKKRAKKTCQIAGCDKGGTMSRKMCRMHYQRWQKGTLDRAPDGTPSPAKKADDKPSTNGHGTDPTRCTAKACTQRRIAADAQLCPQHTTVLRDMASSLRPRFGSEAGNEALARLQDGRTVAS